MNALRMAATGLAKPFDYEPAYVCFGDYTMDANGLSVEREQGRGENRQKAKLWVSAPFEVLGRSRDPQGRGWGKFLRWRDDDGRQHVRHVADAELHGEPAALCAGLANIGLRIDRMKHRISSVIFRVSRCCAG